MADWFKMYENGLDEPRMKYAINKTSDVTPVWIWILTECCRNKSDSFDYNEFIRFGAAQTVNIDEDRVATAIDVLAKIEYIVVSDDVLTVPKWDSRQSEYCRKKGYKKESGQHPDNVPLDKKRGKKKKEDKKAYGELMSVLLTDDEYAKLLAKHGQSTLDKGIEVLDTYISSKGAKYKSHYATMKSDSWVWERVSESNPQQSKPRFTSVG